MIAPFLPGGVPRGGVVPPESLVVPTAGHFVRDTASGLEFCMPRIGSREGWFQDQALGGARTDDDEVVAPAHRPVGAWPRPTLLLDLDAERMDVEPPGGCSSGQVRLVIGQPRWVVARRLGRGETLAETLFSRIGPSWAEGPSTRPPRCPRS